MCQTTFKGEDKLDNNICQSFDHACHIDTCIPTGNCDQDCVSAFLDTLYTVQCRGNCFTTNESQWIAYSMMY